MQNVTRDNAEGKRSRSKAPSSVSGVRTDTAKLSPIQLEGVAPSANSRSVVTLTLEERWLSGSSGVLRESAPGPRFHDTFDARYCLRVYTAGH